MIMVIEEVHHFLNIAAANQKNDGYSPLESRNCCLKPKPPKPKPTKVLSLTRHGNHLLSLRGKKGLPK